MTASLQKYISIEESICLHPAWYGKIPGLVAEKKLRGKAPYTYLLRDGEVNSHYYATFACPDGSVRHQPFTVTVGPYEWHLENYDPRGPFRDETILDVIHFIMHCKKEECTPLSELK
ncbi:MAG TPA: SH2 domain-containing protein [Rhabdochlamydiaceae bacterium]|nr:SH2 domain-containing protein [Rhabdochlamydiaceae bacterium]